MIFVLYIIFLFFCVFFFFNDPATTEIYTYRHPLSLHDALPFAPDHSRRRRSRRCWRALWQTDPWARHGSSTSHPGEAPTFGSSPRPRPSCTVTRRFGSSTVSSSRPMRPPSSRWSRGRSEEHTSELQSLMRISYAVFCLKK